MSDSSAETAAVECARAFIDAFNAQDHERLAGTVYNQFETFWIATCQDTHWGIQFRSSYLITPKPSGT